MKRKFEIGQKLFFVDKYYKTGNAHTFELPITEIGRKYLKVEGLGSKIEIITLQLQSDWMGIECFESKEAYEKEEARIQLANELKYTVDFIRFSLEQLQQIESLIKSFKNT